VLVIALATTVAACDPFFELRREITSPKISAECAERALDLVGEPKRVGVTKSGERWIVRPDSVSVSLLVNAATPSAATVVTGGIGREEWPDVASRLRLVEEVQAALLAACDIDDEQAALVALVYAYQPSSRIR
jgi:hypothetical protein